MFIDDNQAGSHTNLKWIKLLFVLKKDVLKGSFWIYWKSPIMRQNLVVQESWTSNEIQSVSKTPETFEEIFLFHGNALAVGIQSIGSWL